jgi:uncharacterized membrane protein YwzB
MAEYAKYRVLPILTIALATLLSCWALFYLDKDTTSIQTLFKSGNLAALLFYFPPSFTLSYFIYRILSKKGHHAPKLVYALLIGIPLGFAMVIAAFYLLA